MPSDATLLHVSDLHLVKQLAIEPRGLRARVTHVLKAKPHSFGRLEAFRQRIEKVEKEENRPIDLVLGTGDLTTNGDPAALMLARRLLTDDRLYVGDVVEQLLLKGLGGVGDRRLMVPGNHDRYARDWMPVQTRSSAFEHVLGTPSRYPYVAGYRAPGRPNHATEPALVFFVFDSTPSLAVAYSPVGGFSLRRFKPWEITARGRLEDAACDDIIDRAREIANQGTVASLDGNTTLNVDFDRCIRIAVLHHHPVDVRPTTLMENSARFVEACLRAGVDLALFGHDHREYIDHRYGVGPKAVPSVAARHRLHLFCCPSTSEYSARNGFFVYDFYREGLMPAFNFELYEYVGEPAGFILTRRGRGTFTR